MPYQSVFRPDLFKGRTIIVTGGGSGIGRCTAHELVALGANVAILGRTAEKLAEVKAEIEEDGGQVLTQVCDIRDETMVIADRRRARRLWPYRRPREQCRRSISRTDENHLDQGL